jgi:PAS domain S-box-containing protein
MEDIAKTKQELIHELTELRQRIVLLNSGAFGSGTSRIRMDQEAGFDEMLALDSFDNGDDSTIRLNSGGDSTQTLDLTTLFAKDITNSGSFDIRSGIWATTFGRVIQALPIPAMLLDQSCKISVLNEACGKVSPDYESILGSQFSNLFPGPSVASQAQLVVELVFSDRKPRIKESGLKIGQQGLWGRMTFRSIRVLEERFVLVLVEDLTAEKRQLRVNRRQKEALQREIEHRRLSEEALRDSEARFRRIFNHAPMMMQAVDRDGIIRHVNLKWLQDLGYAREEVTGISIESIMSEQSRKSLTSFLEDLWQNRETQEVHCQYLKKDGTALEVLLDSGITDDPVWGIVGLSTLRDVTQQMVLERQLREAQKMEAVGTLAGGIAHDFNNLLQIVLGFSDLLLMGKNRQSREYEGLRSIRDAARRGSDLVNQILAFSRKVETDPRPIDLNDVIEKVERLLRRTIPKMIHVEVQLDQGLKKVLADPGQIEQILINLAINAKDAMPEGGRISIGTNSVTLDDHYCKICPEVQRGDYVRLVVSDTGHGMTKEVLDRIFEPFFTTKPLGQGTGLGLAMVFGLVKIQGGHITCQSESGKGTTFEIYLPAMEMEMGPDLSMSGEIPALGTETILLVDDEELIRNWGAEVLSNAGYTVITAGDGREALDLYRMKRDSISLIILDLVMPRLGGKQCLEEFVSIDKTAKVLVASGFSIDELTRTFLLERVKGIVKKPFEVTALLKAVRSALDNP